MYQSLCFCKNNGRLMENQRLGTRNDKMCAESFDGNTPNTLNLFCPSAQTGQLLGIFFWKKDLITCLLSTIKWIGKLKSHEKARLTRIFFGIDWFKSRVDFMILRDCYIILLLLFSFWQFVMGRVVVSSTVIHHFPMSKEFLKPFVLPLPWVF